MREPRVVIVFGLAGSGKSTLAAKLAEEFGLRVIHPSSIVRDLISGKKIDVRQTQANDGFWESAEGSKLLHDRLEDVSPVDLAADQILLQEVQKGGVVIDSWTLPWISEVGIKIHLQAELEVRARRAALRGDIPLSQARERIAQKDEDTRQLFLRLYGFDIKADYQVFHHTIATDQLDPDQVFSEACRYLEKQ